jgi:maleate isomerase
MYGNLGRIGLLVPNMNTIMEVDFHRLAPDGVSVHTSRISWKKPENSVSALTELRENSISAAKDVAAANVDVIVFGCTGGSVLGGASGEQAIVDRIFSETEIPTITTAMATLAGLREMGISRVSVASPFSSEMDEKLKQFLEENEIQVANVASFGQRDVSEYEKYAPSALLDLGRQAFVPEADGVFFSCNQIRAIEVVSDLEKELGKPVVTSVQASLWLALKTIGVRVPVNGFGKLLARV